MNNMLLLLVGSLIISGCATSYSPSQMSKVVKAECITISEDSYWREYRGIGLLWEEGVSAGVYRSLYQDKEGTFFAGPGRPVWQQMGVSSSVETAPKSRVYKLGGIWLPKNEASEPRMYYIFEANPQTNSQVSTVSGELASNQMYSGAGIGPSAVGGAIGGAIVGASIKADDGKIFLMPEIGDRNLVSKLKQVSACPANESNPSKDALNRSLN